jgi:NAD+ synthase
MVTLYQIAASKNGLVVGTGNKIEDFGVGFFTKYGDGGVDISPIADLTKTEVRELAKKLGVSGAILNAKPTDGLWDEDKSDEDQLGATYEELEWAMSYLESSDNNTILSDRQNRVIEIYQSFNTRNKHKMIGIPIFKK